MADLARADAMERVRLTVQLFGALREHGAQIELAVPKGAGPIELRAALAEALAIDPALLAISALANEDEVLDESATFERDGTLAVLPPVCGG